MTTIVGFEASPGSPESSREVGSGGLLLFEGGVDPSRRRHGTHGVESPGNSAPHSGHVRASGIIFASDFILRELPTELTRVIFSVSAPPRYAQSRQP